jgi:predicted PurR-regulated permease PerM
VRQSLLTVAMLVLVGLAWMLRDLVMLLGFAALLAYALDPVVSWVGRARLPGRRTFPRGLAAALVIVLLFLVAGAALAEAVPRLLHQVVRFAEAAPATVARIDQELRTFIAAHGWSGLLKTDEGDGNGGASPALDAARKALSYLLANQHAGLGGLAGLILLPLFAFYMLADRSTARSVALDMVPAQQRPDAVRFLDALDRALRAYVRGQALVCIVMGAAMAIVLRLLGFPVALLLGVVVGLGEVIPILGFWIAALAIGLEGYSKSPQLAVVGILAYMVVNNLIGTFVSPRLLGSQVKLHPLIVNVSVIGGGILLGPSGAILALPAAAMIKALLDEFGPRRYGSGVAPSAVTTTLS